MCTVCARLAFLFPRAAPPKMLEKHGFRQGRGFLPSKRIEIMAFSNRMFLLRRRIPFNNNACMQGHRIFLSLFVESLSLPSEVLHSREKSPFCFSPPPPFALLRVRPSVRGRYPGPGRWHPPLLVPRPGPRRRRRRRPPRPCGRGGGRAGVNELGEETNGKGRAKEEGIGGGERRSQGKREEGG